MFSGARALVSGGRRLACSAFVLALPLLGIPLAAGAEPAPKLFATRVWPASDYTRVTFEARAPLKYQFQTLKNPERLVVDLEGVELSTELTEIAKKVREDDPYIKGVRVARFKPNVVRVVFDLRGEVKPGIFPLQPAGDYQHRLVLDIYPAKPMDPIMALLTASGNEPAPSEEAKEADALKAEPNLGPNRDGGFSAKKPPAPPAVAAPVPQASTDPEPAAVPQAEPEALPPADKIKKGARLFTVAIDPGHGGEDPGAKGRKGTLEKHITLAIAKKVKALIDREPGMRAVLTRDGDYFVALNERVAKARRWQADLFVSVHADAFMQAHANGSSVFALSERGATSAAARWLAQRENEADLIGGVNLDVKDPFLAKTLLDLSQTATINDSLKLGKAVLGELGEINRLHKPYVEQAGFAVLKAPDIPSILVETAFISNPDEERRLNEPGYQDKMADAIVSGIKAYYAKSPALARGTRVATVSPR